MTTPKLLLAAMTLVFSVSLTAQPGAGKTLDFNGTSTYLTCGTLNLSGTALTMQAWIKVDAFKSAFPYITSIMGTEAAGGHTALLRLGDATLANNKLQFVLYSGSTHYKLDGISTLSANKWYHVAATFDGTDMKIYINGILDASATNAISIVSNEEFAIGRNYGNDRIMNGEIDEVNVWGAALSLSTIRDWMCKKITAQHPNYAALKGYWPLNEGTGTGSQNLGNTGSANNAVFVGTPAWVNSGASIGNASKHAYAATYSLGLSHAQGDSLHVSHTSGSVQGAHLYRVDAAPYDTVAPSPLQHLDSTHYWGVFVIGTSNYAVDYDYNGNAMIAASNDCNLAYAHRTNGAATAWTAAIPASTNYSTNTSTWNSSATRELIPAISTQGPHAISFVPTLPLCPGSTNGSLTVSVSGGTPPYSYQWSSGSIGQVAANLASGWHYITITDNNGCQSTDSFLLNNPTSIGAIINVTKATCALTNNGAISLTPIGGAGQPYTFLWDDPNNSTTASLTEIYAGEYNVTITDANGCTNTFPVTVSSIGPDPIVNLGSDTAVCKGTTFMLKPTLTNGSLSSYLWSTGSTNTTITVKDPGTYSVTVTNFNGTGCHSIDSITVDVMEAVQVKLGPDVSATGSHTINAGGGFAAYEWSTGAAGQTLKVTKTGTYFITTTDMNGCKAYDDIFVTIWPTGIGNVGANEIAFWPNPVGDMLWVQCAPGSLVEVFDLTGRKVFSQKASQQTTTIATAELRADKYLIRVSSQESVWTGSFVRQ